MASFFKYICSFFCPKFCCWFHAAMFLCTHFVFTPFSEVEICPKVFNRPEFHFSEVYFFQTWYFSEALIAIYWVKWIMMSVVARPGCSVPLWLEFSKSCPKNMKYRTSANSFFPLNSFPLSIVSVATIQFMKNCHNAETIWKFPHFLLSKEIDSEETICRNLL